MLQLRSTRAIVTLKMFCQIRLASQGVTCLKYAEYGNPVDVLKLCVEPLQEVKENEVVVKVLLAPINPSDINTIQGKYPIKPKLPAVAGTEFVAEVVKVGKKVRTLMPSDRVIPNHEAIGTWRSYGVYSYRALKKVSHKIDLVNAATMNVNPCTAYRMLTDFVCVKQGDTVLQNGANSAVGQIVHQICKYWQISSIGVVRNRPGIAELKERLKSLGACEVLTEQEIEKTNIFKSEYKKPKLALNCIGGKSALSISRHLDNKGYLVTYGGMSLKPVTAGTASLIFKDISYVGFWITKWSMENPNTADKWKMYAELSYLMESGKLQPPAFEVIPARHYKRALKTTTSGKGFIGKKYLLDFRNC